MGISGAWTDISCHAEKVDWDKRPKWQIAYGSWLARKTVNLLVAGRCFSYEPALFQDARIIGTCLITGHAAGAATAVSIQQKTTPRSVDVSLVQNLLKSQNAL